VADLLRENPPKYVAVVLEPAELDFNFVRRFLMFSTEVDADPFADFGYGFITGATAQAAIGFVDNIIRAESENIQDMPLRAGAYAASSLNLVYEDYCDGYLSDLNAESCSTIYLECGDPGVLDYFDQHSHLLLGNKVLDIGHNGDPHMLWLFEGGNMVEDTWDYDPALVEDPPVQRLGLTSQHIGSLDLYPAVAFNGACHAGAPKRALVEADILATFGDTHDLVRFYEMSDDFSFCLQILQTGLTGYFAPTASNNANDSGEDMYNAFLYNQPLGDIQKRSVDAIVMAFLGNRPRLHLYTDGEPVPYEECLASGSFDPGDFGWGELTMLSGKANRVYFGDPMYNPFALDASDALKLVTATVTETSPTRLEVALAFDKPDGHWPVWDKFHDGQARIYVTVELPADFATGVDVTVQDASESYTRFIHALETHRGKVILHLEFDAPWTGTSDWPSLDPMAFTATVAVEKI
jgi:hypothetical protein